ncbi:MAG: hypothetical protein QNJ30_19295 [Kiloniellales bacterium]|nr:hypothetical protein [Kiloniellales bacterium]
MVNGRTVWDGSAHSGVRPGRALRRQDQDPPRAAAEQDLARARSALAGP